MAESDRNIATYLHGIEQTLVKKISSPKKPANHDVHLTPTLPQAVGRELLQREDKEVGQAEGRRQQALLLHVRAGPHLQGVRRHHELQEGGDRVAPQEDRRHHQARGL